MVARAAGRRCPPYRRCVVRTAPIWGLGRAVVAHRGMDVRWRTDGMSRGRKRGRGRGRERSRRTACTPALGGPSSGRVRVGWARQKHNEARSSRAPATCEHVGRTFDSPSAAAEDRREEGKARRRRAAARSDRRTTLGNVVGPNCARPRETSVAQLGESVERDRTLRVGNDRCHLDPLWSLLVQIHWICEERRSRRQRGRCVEDVQRTFIDDACAQKCIRSVSNKLTDVTDTSREAPRSERRRDHRAQEHDSIVRRWTSRRAQEALPHRTPKCLKRREEREGDRAQGKVSSAPRTTSTEKAAPLRDASSAHGIDRVKNAPTRPNRTVGIARSAVVAATTTAGGDPWGICLPAA